MDLTPGSVVCIRNVVQYHGVTLRRTVFSEATNQPCSNGATLIYPVLIRPNLAWFHNRSYLIRTRLILPEPQSHTNPGPWTPDQVHTHTQVNPPIGRGKKSKMKSLEVHENVIRNHRHDSSSMKKRAKEKEKNWVLVLCCNVGVIRLDASKRCLSS